MPFERSQFEAAGGDWEMGQLCNEMLDTVASTRLKEVPGKHFIKSKVAWKFAVLRQALTYRLVDLVEGTMFLWGAGHWLSALIVGRSTLETVALIHSIEVRARKALDNKNITELDELVEKDTFSAKSPDYLLDPDFVATNILNAIDRLDKEVPAIRKYYDTLSEYAHPNGKGHIFSMAN